MEPWNCYSVGC